MPTEEMSLMLGSHGAETQNAHNQEDQEEHDGDYQNWHTSPLRPLWNVMGCRAVIAITGAREGQTESIV